MRKLTYLAIFEPTETGYSVYFPDLLGCVSYGENFEEAHKKHQEMGVICFENHEMGLYFIQDPDGYWLEIVPSR